MSSGDRGGDAPPVKVRMTDQRVYTDLRVKIGVSRSLLVLRRLIWAQTRLHRVELTSPSSLPFWGAVRQ